MVAHLFLGDVAQGVVQRLHPEHAVALVALGPHADPDTVPQGRQPGVVHLQDQAGFGDDLVFDR